MYDNPPQMEPLLPLDRDGILGEMSLDLIKRSATLSGMLHPITRASVVRLLRVMNSYYSNLIEGHNTHPISIEKALKNDSSEEPAKRALQLESLAHIKVQKLLEERLAAEPSIKVCSPEFLCWIHAEFYKRMPDEFRAVKDENGQAHAFQPGEFRNSDVQVGRHIPPTHTSINAFLKRFSEFYDTARHRNVSKIIAASAAHHRLAWIHPFMDGNGRVTRLFTNAYLIQAGVEGHGLWTVTRGFARQRDAYVRHLIDADQPRRNDLDGRGNLSERGLASFCDFFITTALDQIDFMGQLLEIDRLQDRILAYVQRSAAAKELDERGGLLLRETLLRGEVPRGDAARITGLGERAARDVLGQLVREELLESETPKSPVRLGFPTKAVGYYFPRLYPEGVEETLLKQ